MAMEVVETSASSSSAALGVVKKGVKATYFARHSVAGASQFSWSVPEWVTFLRYRRGKSALQGINVLLAQASKAEKIRRVGSNIHRAVNNLIRLHKNLQHV